MKKLLLSMALFSLFWTASAADGVHFREGKWKDILSQAKMENKLIFIDVYTSWCGPCKRMSAEVFPDQTVGELFNDSFINYQIDAEKGEGVDIAKTFDVRAFPTYLFINGDGQLVYRLTGYMPAPDFLKEAKIALKEKDDPKPLVQWDKEYKAGNRDKDFLIGYMKRRALLKIPSAELQEELFPLLTKEDLSNKDLMSSLIYYDAASQITPGGQLFNYVLNNHKNMEAGGLLKYPLGILENGILNYFRKVVIPDQDAAMVPVTAAAYKEVLVASAVDPREIVVREKQLPMQYYNGTQNEQKLIASAIDFVNNGVLKLDIAAKQAEDKKAFDLFMHPYLTGEKDSITDQAFQMKRLKKNNNMVSLSYSLREAAEDIYSRTDDSQMLEMASRWAKQANEWFPHFSSQAVYAGLLMKTGHRQEAVAAMRLASQDRFLKMAPDVKKLLVQNALTMESGALPTHLWNNR